MVLHILRSAAASRADASEIDWGAGFPDIEADIPAGLVRLARRNGQPAGTFVLRWSDERIWGRDDNGAGYLHRLAIAPGEKGRGTGVALIGAAEEAVRARDRRWLRLDCNRDNPAAARVLRGPGLCARGRRAGAPDQPGRLPGGQPLSAPGYSHPVSNRAILITGASRGIGRAIAGAFAAAGDRVAVHYGTSAAQAQEVAAGLAGTGHLVVQADLADPSAVREMVDAAAAGLGGLDVVVNNAGTGGSHPITETPYEEWQAAWQHTLAVNLTGVANVMWCAGPAHGGGRRRADRQCVLARRLPR